MDKNTSQLFKACLMDDKARKVEVHQFIIKQKFLKSFAYLSQKIETIFPQLKDCQFKIYWQDEDSDYITIGDDDELIIALNEIPMEVKKLYLKVITKDGSNLAATKYGMTQRGVTCTVCGDQIKNYCYKCLQCKEFDLCENCERQHLHSHHFMLRVSPFVPFEHLDEVLSIASSTISKYEKRIKSNGSTTNAQSAMAPEPKFKEKKAERNISKMEENKYIHKLIRNQNRQKQKRICSTDCDTSSSVFNRHNSVGDVEEAKIDSPPLKSDKGDSCRSLGTSTSSVEALGITYEVEAITPGQYTNVEEREESPGEDALPQDKAVTCVNDLYRELDQVSEDLAKQKLCDDPEENDWSFVYKQTGMAVVNSAEKITQNGSSEIEGPDVNTHSGEQKNDENATETDVQLDFQVINPTDIEQAKNE